MSTFFKWDEMPQAEMTPTIRLRPLSGQNVMVVEVTLDRGGIVAEHQHPHEQISLMISGKVEFIVGNEKKIVGPGEVVHIPPNVPHSVYVLENAVVYDVFSPIREDFLSDEPPEYMKQG